MPFLKPDRYLSRITVLDPKADLIDRGINCVLLDIDNTIRSRETHLVPDDILAWMDAAKDAGVKLCLLSNNWHANAHELSDELGLPIVAKAMKPLPHGYVMALTRMGVKARETVVIGDQMFTDVSGAHLLGIKAYMVAPLAVKDLAHTVALRKVQDVVLGGKTPEVMGQEAAESAKSADAAAMERAAQIAAADSEADE